MTVLLPSQITADTTKVTADTAINRPVTVMRTKLRALLPPWFIDDDPYLDGVLNGISALLLFGQSLLAYARKQTRVATSTGGFLDLTAYDFFRNRIRRRPRERDADYQVRIRQEVIRPRATRAAIVRAVTELTGRVPDVIEPFNPGDCGAYGSGTIAYGGVAAVAAATSGYGSSFGGYGAGHFAYVVPGPVNGITGGAGCYGSLSLPNQIFIRVYRGPGTFANPGATGGYGSGTFAYGGGTDGVPALSGYGAGLGAYGVGSLCYGSPQPPYARFAGAGFYGSASERTSVTDAEIYDAIAETTAAGVTAWTMIRGV